MAVGIKRGRAMQGDLEFGCDLEVEILVGRGRPHAEVTEEPVWSKVEFRGEFG